MNYTKNQYNKRANLKNDTKIKKESNKERNK